MKILTKVALVSAMAISANAMAMQAMDDESLSAATGQDGVTISLTGNVSMDYLAIVDGDGAPGTVGTAPNTIATGLNGTLGAIQIGDGTTGSLSLTSANGINLVVDADGNGTNPVLNVQADLGTTTIAGVNIYVANTDASGSSLTNAVSVLDVGTITLNNLVANIQLGSQPQGGLIKLVSSISGGLTLSNLALKQGATNGIGLGSVNVSSTNAATAGDLDLNLTMNATNNGLEITGLTGMNIASSALTLGNLTPNTGSDALGALYIKNLSVGNIAIRGH